MALLSIDMIREIQGVADTYAQRERERLNRVNAPHGDRHERNDAGQTRRRARDRADA